MLHRNRCRFGAVANLQFVIDTINMVSHRVSADPKGPADFLVGESSGEHLQNFQFARAQVGTMGPRSKSAGNSRRKVLPACMDGGNGGYDLFA